jgi:hypothetical protein
MLARFTIGFSVLVRLSWASLDEAERANTEIIEHSQASVHENLNDQSFIDERSAGAEVSVNYYYGYNESRYCYYDSYYGYEGYTYCGYLDYQPTCCGSSCCAYGYDYCNAENECTSSSSPYYGVYEYRYCDGNYCGYLDYQPTCCGSTCCAYGYDYCNAENECTSSPYYYGVNEYRYCDGNYCGYLDYQPTCCGSTCCAYGYDYCNVDNECSTNSSPYYGVDENRYCDGTYCGYLDYQPTCCGSTCCAYGYDYCNAANECSTSSNPYYGYEYYYCASTYCGYLDYQPHCCGDTCCSSGYNYCNEYNECTASANYYYGFYEYRYCDGVYCGYLDYTPHCCGSTCCSSGYNFCNQLGECSSTDDDHIYYVGRYCGETYCGDLNYQPTCCGDDGNTCCNSDTDYCNHYGECTATEFYGSYYNFKSIQDDVSYQWQCEGYYCQSQGGIFEKPNGCCGGTCCYDEDYCCNEGFCTTCATPSSDVTTATSVIIGATVGGFAALCAVVAGLLYWLSAKKSYNTLKLEAGTGQVVVNPVSAGQVELHSLNPEPTYYYNNSSSFPQPVPGGVSSSMAQVGTPFGSVPSAPPVYASGGFATGYAVVPGNREHSM